MTRRAALLHRGRAGVVLTLLLAGLTVLAGCTRPPATPTDAGPGPSAEIAAFAADWSAGRVSDAAALTSQPQAAAQLMTTVAADLEGHQARRRARHGDPFRHRHRHRRGDPDLDAAGRRKLEVRRRVDLEAVEFAPGTWKLQFNPTVIHPELGAQQTMVVRTTRDHAPARSSTATTPN